MKARIHKNLHNGLWVISVNNKVQGYCSSCALSDTQVHLSETIRHKNLHRPGKAPKRSVHLWVSGTLSNVTGYVPKNMESLPTLQDIDTSGETRTVSYNPFKNDTFMLSETETYKGGELAVFSSGGTMKQVEQTK